MPRTPSAARGDGMRWHGAREGCGRRCRSNASQQLPPTPPSSTSKPKTGPCAHSTVHWGLTNTKLIRESRGPRPSTAATAPSGSDCSWVGRSNVSQPGVKVGGDGATALKNISERLSQIQRSRNSTDRTCVGDGELPPAFTRCHLQ